MGTNPFVPSPWPLPTVQSFPHTEARGRWTNSVGLTLVDYNAHLELCTTAYVAFQRSLNKDPSFSILSILLSLYPLPFRLCTHEQFQLCIHEHLCQFFIPHQALQ